MIKEAFGCPEADVHFLVGGTQTNQTAIAAFLRPWEAAVCTSLGHIAVHETGAVEATGHKVITCPSEDGILTPEMVRAAVAAHPDEHMVKPKLAYISDSTEVGDNLPAGTALRPAGGLRRAGALSVPRRARLGSALASDENDIRPSDLPACCDAFYVGGTKNGAMFGEALVIVERETEARFPLRHQAAGRDAGKGAAAGRPVSGRSSRAGWRIRSGWKSGRHENGLARKLQEGIVKAGYPLLVRSPSNQVFPIFPDGLVEKLAEGFKFEVQKKFPDGKTCIRLVTSWATEEEAVDAFLKAI